LGVTLSSNGIVNQAHTALANQSIKSLLDSTLFFDTVSETTDKRNLICTYTKLFLWSMGFSQC